MPDMPNTQPRHNGVTGTAIAEVYAPPMATVMMVPNYDGWRLYSAQVHDVGSKRPLSDFDVAVKLPSQKPIGDCSAIEFKGCEPVWFAFSGDRSKAIQTCCDKVRDAGHVG